MVHNDSCDNFKRNNNFERRIFFPETGQLETVGNGFQLNNKLLERALIDYLESIPQQVFVFSLSSLFFFFSLFFSILFSTRTYIFEPFDNVQEEQVPSLFRERERSSSRKRDFNSDRLNVDNKELTKLLLEELQDGSPYNLGDLDDEGYVDVRQMLYDRYRGDRGNKIYELVIYELLIIFFIKKNDIF